MSNHADHSMVVKADARAMSAVTALDTRVSERWLASKPADRIFDGKAFDGTSHCVSYKLDADGNVTDAKVFRLRRPNRKPDRYTNTPTVGKPHRINASDLAPIGNII